MENKTQNEMPRQEATPEDPPGPSLIKKVNVLKSPFARLMFGALGVTALIGTVIIVASRTAGEEVERVVQTARDSIANVDGLKVIKVRAVDAGILMTDPPPVPFDIKDDARKSDKKDVHAGAAPAVPAKNPPPPAAPALPEGAPGKKESPSAGVKLVEKEAETPPGGGKAEGESDAATGDGAETAKPKVAEKGLGKAMDDKVPSKKKGSEKSPPGGAAGRYGKPVVPGKARTSVRIVFKGDAPTVNALAASRLLTVGVLVNGANAARYFPIPEDVAQSFDGPVTNACYYLTGYGERDGVNTIVKLSDTLMSRITLALKDAGSSGNAAIEISPDGSVRSLLKRL